MLSLINHTMIVWVGQVPVVLVKRADSLPAPQMRRSTSRSDSLRSTHRASGTSQLDDLPCPIWCTKARLHSSPVSLYTPFFLATYAG